MQPQENKWLVSFQPLPPPAIDPRLEELGALCRSTECLRHLILSIEYWISPNGRLRHWITVNLCLAASLLIPAVFLMPVVSLVLHEVDGCLALLVSIALKLIVLGILVFVIVCILKHRHKHFPSSSKGSARRRK